MFLRGLPPLVYKNALKSLFDDKYLIVIYFVPVPSAPQNLTANRVTSEEIHLSWAPPLTFLAITLPNHSSQTTTEKDLTVISKTQPQSDEPSKDDNEMISDAPLQEFDYTWYRSDHPKFDDLINNDNYRSKRELRSHRHRKRRQNNSTDTKSHLEKSAEDIETYQAIDMPIEVVKKSYNSMIPVKNPTQIAYVLYYEQGVPRSDTSTIIGVQSSADVKKKNVFSSDLGMEHYSRATKNLTLLNTSGVLTKVVGFRLKNLSK